MSGVTNRLTSAPVSQDMACSRSPGRELPRSCPKGIISPWSSYPRTQAPTPGYLSCWKSLIVASIDEHSDDVGDFSLVTKSTR